MNNKRKHFKTLDPVIQKDIYIWLGIIWFSWVICQAAFILSFEWLSTQGLLVDTRTVVVVFLIISSTMLLIMLLSFSYFINKFLGPIHRIRQELNRAKEENKDPEFMLRDGDYYQDIARHINNMRFKE